MSNWSNIEISVQDSEIIRINKFEENLGDLSDNVQKIRELIRRFEICHFKYKEHLEYINDSISLLSPIIEPTDIGKNHVSKGSGVLKNDKTGRSIIGQRYLCSLKVWLGDYPFEDQEYLDSELNQKVSKWLNEKNKDKERIVRLLIARLAWDWKSYKKYKHGQEFNELEWQVCRMDICHYAFPRHLELVIQGIGRMQPIGNFEGCGSYNSEIQNYAEEQFFILCDFLKSSNRKIINQNKNERIKIWLIASLAKTLKEQVGLKASLPEFNYESLGIS